MSFHLLFNPVYQAPGKRKSPPPVNTLVSLGTRGSSFAKEQLSTTHREGSSARLHQDRRHDARLPGHDASWAGHTTSHPGIQQAALGHQQHRPLAAVVHRGPQVMPRSASSGTPSPAADRTLLHDITP